MNPSTKLSSAIVFLVMTMLAVIYLQTQSTKYLFPSEQREAVDPRPGQGDGLPAARQPVLVTGFSADHFDEGQALIRTIHESLSGSKLIVYDLGLSDSQRHRLTKYCGCELRSFVASRYPPHVSDLHTYAFKPIIINETLVEFGFVFWLDASVRFTSSNVSATWELARSVGFAVAQEDYVASCLIHPSVYKYFNITDTSRFRRAREIAATFILLYATPRTMEHIVQPWLKCALDQQCIAPDGHQLYGCRFELAPEFCGCHRYDQSALNAIVYNLFPEACNFDMLTGKGDAASFSIGFVERVNRLLPKYDILRVSKGHTEPGYFPQR